MLTIFLSVLKSLVEALVVAVALVAVLSPSVIIVSLLGLGAGDRRCSEHGDGNGESQHP